MADARLCKDCRHSTPRFSDIRFCNRPENIIASRVDGELEYERTCRTLREWEGGCGKAGRWFEPKERT